MPKELPEEKKRQIKEYCRKNLKPIVGVRGWGFRCDTLIVYIKDSSVILPKEVLSVRVIPEITGEIITL